MACKREDRVRRNTIAFWVSDDEKEEVNARIILSGLPKGEYYRKAILGQHIQVVAGNYMSNRLSMVLDQIYKELQKCDMKNTKLLAAIVKELINLNKTDN